MLFRKVSRFVVERPDHINVRVERNDIILLVSRIELARDCENVACSVNRNDVLLSVNIWLHFAGADHVAAGDKPNRTPTAHDHVGANCH